MDISSEARKLIIKFATNNKDVNAINFINEDPCGVNIKELSGGVINYVYRVSSADNKRSVVLKHAKDTAKAYPGLTLSMERQKLEYACLKLFSSSVPGSVPEPYCLDIENNIIAMEDLSACELLGCSLKKHGPNIDVAYELGRVLARMHLATMRTKTNPEIWQELHKYRSEDSRSLVSHHLFVKFYDETTELAKLPENDLESHRQYAKEIIDTGIQRKLLELFDDEQCLLQPDNHWQSMFVKDTSVAMFDFDLPAFSHPGLSVGYIVTTYVTCFLVYLSRGGYTEGRTKLNEDGRRIQGHFQKAVQTFLTKYLEEVRLTDEALRNFISDTALFAGNSHFLISVFELMEVFDPDVTIANQTSLLHPGFKMLKSHTDITTIDQLVKAAFDIQTFN